MTVADLRVGLAVEYLGDTPDAVDAVGELGGEVTWDPVDGDGVHDQPTTRFERQTPSLFWPEDQAWCGANDIEASFTLIGGTAQLIDALHGNPALEATPVD